MKKLTFKIWVKLSFSSLLLFCACTRVNQKSTTIENAVGLWQNTSRVNAPEARRYRSGKALWTGSKLWVWGSTGAASDVSTGGLYDPLLDSWSLTSLTHAPEARHYHTNVWTGSKAIVWGGINSGSYFNSGGTYDPVTNTWTSISTINAPTGRYLHSAVWTGSKMIIWGGYSEGAALTQTGGIYDPATDSWTSLSTINSPSGRMGHLAEWTGSKMVVWGGQDATGLVNTGAVYDPATDTWSSITSTNAPEARLYFSSVWTGKKIIIWGGWSLPGFVNLNSGGVYDPELDVWTPTQMINAPEERYFHTAVWTGTEMLVWGGKKSLIPPGQNTGPSIDFNTGAAYDSDTDSWREISALNAPVARSGHVAIWSGNEMIVWGGSSNSSGLVNTGGRYLP
jgi:N-acetylneuraminic acid mutarotase